MKTNLSTIETAYWEILTEANDGLEYGDNLQLNWAKQNKISFNDLNIDSSVPNASKGKLETVLKFLTNNNQALPIANFSDDILKKLSDKLSELEADDFFKKASSEAPPTPPTPPPSDTTPPATASGSGGAAG